jgi:hypothetical protein
MYRVVMIRADLVLVAIPKIYAAIGREGLIPEIVRADGNRQQRNTQPQAAA